MKDQLKIYKNLQTGKVGIRSHFILTASSYLDGKGALLQFII